MVVVLPVVVAQDVVMVVVEVTVVPVVPVLYRVVVLMVGVAQRARLTAVITTTGGLADITTGVVITLQTTLVMVEMAQLVPLIRYLLLIVCFGVQIKLLPELLAAAAAAVVVAVVMPREPAHASIVVAKMVIMVVLVAQVVWEDRADTMGEESLVFMHIIMAHRAI